MEPLQGTCHGQLADPSSYGKRRILQVSWFHEPLPILEKLDIPMLWVLGGKDLEAPNEVTIAELERLRTSGKPIDLKIYPDADHGIVEFEEKDGERVYTHYAPGYFELESGWVREKALTPGPSPASGRGVNSLP